MAWGKRKPKVVGTVYLLHFSEPYEKAQKPIDLCQPYRRTILQLEDKISLLESKITYLKDEVDTLESNQY